MQIGRSSHDGVSRRGGDGGLVSGPSLHSGVLVPSLFRHDSSPGQVPSTTSTFPGLVNRT